MSYDYTVIAANPTATVRPMQSKRANQKLALPIQQEKQNSTTPFEEEPSAFDGLELLIQLRKRKKL